MKSVQLKPIKESTEDYEAIERELKSIFKSEIYLPLMKELGRSNATFQNSKYSLIDAITSGRIAYVLRSFTGEFSSSISKELKRLGAKWDRAHGSWMIPLSSLPMDLRSAISTSAVRIKEKLAAIDKKLAQIVPEEIAGRVSIEKIFDRLIIKTDQSFLSTIRGITVAPQLTPERRKRLANEWQNNMKLWVKDFTEKEIIKLRKNVQATAFSGARHETIIKTIQSSYDVSQNKAKFLARQETSLLLTKFKESRYTDSGVDEYIWGCVAGSKNHPTRPWHKALEGKKFRWDSPPITSKPGEPIRRNNPGQDFFCRCFAKPVVKFHDGVK